MRYFGGDAMSYSATPLLIKNRVGRENNYMVDLDKLDSTLLAMSKNEYNSASKGTA